MKHGSLVVLITLVGGATAFAQMEKRASDQFFDPTFAAAKPAVGTLAPDLVLADLDGRPWSLHELAGRTIVLIKGSYT
jgi:hypothetical protein